MTRRRHSKAFRQFTPCIEAGDDCSKCHTETPKYVTVVIAGVSLCGCMNCAGLGSSMKVEGTIDGTYVLPQSASDPCKWYKDFGSALGITETHYNGYNCTGGIAAGPFSSVTMSWTRSSGYFVVWTPWTKLVNVPYAVTVRECLDTVFLDHSTAYCQCSGYRFGERGSVTIYPGDLYGGGRCPGGSPIYTDTDLSAHVGKVVEIAAVCYRVQNNPDGDESDGAVTVTQVCDDCPDCCDDTC